MALAHQGSEWIVEAYGCDAVRLADPASLRALFDAVIRDLALHPVAPTQWHQFPSPGGITGMVMLAESHLTVHTFPEHGSACLNLFCCTPRTEWPWRARLEELLGAEQVTCRQLQREYVSPLVSTRGPLWTVPQPHGATCANCGAPVRFLWAQAVQTTCPYCRSVLVRRDLQLERVGRQADFPVTGSPIQIGTEGRWRERTFMVVGRLTYAWARGRWNEWHCVLNDGHSAWLSDAQLEYAMTEQADPSGVMPELSRVHVGESYFWNDTAYDVVNVTEAHYLGTEGELPFTSWERTTCRFVDLQTSQGGFATIDGTERPPLLYLGEYLSFDQLAFRNLREFEGCECVRGERPMVNPVASAPVPRVSALNCPSCGAGIELHAQGWAVSVVCAACGAQLDATDENLRVLQYGERVQLTPRIPLGTRGTWKGAPWEVIGCQVVTITVDEVDYSWTEYVCFNPFRGFLYLSEYEGHWNVIEKLRRRPERERDGAQPTVDLDGVTYKHFQTASARTTAALGEFPWELRVGDSVVSRDFVAPPYLLSAEASENEVTWSLGTYTKPALIQKAFGLERRLLEPIGVFANQPNPYAGLPKRMFTTFGVAVVVMVVMFFANILLASDRMVFSRGYTFDRAAAENAAFVTPPFELDGRPSGLAIEIGTDLDNDWVFFALSLINEATGETREVTRQVSYYTGVDSDGSWTEGTRQETVRLAAVPAGRYFLRVEPEGGEPGKSSIGYTLSVRRDVPHFAWYGVALLVLLAPTVLAVIPAAGFESRRWAESDHAPSGGTDDE